MRDFYPARRNERAIAGLTMIEMAIVILVVGVLLAGFIAYKEIVHVTRLRKIATEVQNIGIAARTFEQKYNALPGDFNDADAQLPDCQVNPDGSSNNANFCRNGNGNGRIGRWCHFMWSQGCGQTGSGLPAADPDGNSTVESYEVIQFWKHLYLASLISGVIDPRYDPSTPPRWQVSNPESAVWKAGYVISGQGAFIGGAVDVNFFPTPEYVPMVVAPDADMGGSRALNLTDAHYIDSKYDDDGAGSGSIWWGPITQTGSPNDGTGCRANANAWETRNSTKSNCVFSWTIF